MMAGGSGGCCISLRLEHVNKTAGPKPRIATAAAIGLAERLVAHREQEEKNSGGRGATCREAWAARGDCRRTTDRRRGALPEATGQQPCVHGE